MSHAKDVRSHALVRALPHRLGPANPCPTAVHMEPFSTSAFKVVCDSFEYLLLPPRSALESVRPALTGGRLRHGLHVLLLVRWSILLLYTRWRLGIGGRAWAPSIFGAGPFGRWVITHSLADFDFHDHRPAVWMNRHPLWCLHERALGHLNPHVRFIPHRQFCLPKMAH